MSMKCVRGLNHKTHCDSYSYTYKEILSQVPEGRYQGVESSLWPLATVAWAKLHYICIKKIWYEYEVSGGSQS